MGTEMSFLLSLNAGSSSIKCAAYNIDHRLEVACSVAIENIGEETAVLLTKSSPADDEHTYPVVADTHTVAMSFILGWLQKHIPLNNIATIGHRFVHGGSEFHGPTIISQGTIDRLQKLSALDPVHMTSALETLSIMTQHFPNIQQVACFDTSFFTNIPELAKIMPLPKYVRDKGVQRYGFHGLSYTYLLENFRHNEGELAANGLIVMAHLGSGASLTSISKGKPIDMTMGFTPASGIPMGTRSGSIDPGIVLFLNRTLDQTAEQFDQMVNKQSGLLAISETTSDMHDLLQAQTNDPRAEQAIKFFCYEVTKAIGALTTTLGGLNSLIFTGGIGERSAEIRQRICDNLLHLGIRIDPDANHGNKRCISADESDVGVHIIHTDESLIIARQTLEITKETPQNANR